MVTNATKTFFLATQSSGFKLPLWHLYLSDKLLIEEIMEVYIFFHLETIFSLLVSKRRRKFFFIILSPACT